jgi:hypothetical protein
LGAEICVFTHIFGFGGGSATGACRNPAGGCAVRGRRGGHTIGSGGDGKPRRHLERVQRGQHSGRPPDGDEGDFNGFQLEYTVPEPGTMLLTLPLAALALRRRR